MKIDVINFLCSCGNKDCLLSAPRVLAIFLETDDDLQNMELFLNMANANGYKVSEVFYMPDHKAENLEGVKWQ